MSGSEDTEPVQPGLPQQPSPERLRRRSRFLRERAEALELKERVAPRRARVVRARRVWWVRSFRG